MPVSLLSSMREPRDLQAIPEEQLPELAAQIRSFLVEKVSATGGHLGPNLGVVELTMALHRVFNSPEDVLLWDTGHQAYVHKIITGRADDFDHLRQRGGLSGYPSRAESVHDVIENSHASTALSYADGIAKAFERRGVLGQRHVVAVIGDGGLTGGMAWEALNNIAGSDRQVIVVVNDNARSYSPTIGGLAHHLSTLRTTQGYERFLSWGKKVLRGTPVVGEPIYGTLHGMKKGLRDVVLPQGMFEDLGLKYVGPVDGHDMAELEHALRRAKAFPGPVLVHAITQKGRGYLPAEQDEADHFHGVGIIDPDTGQPLSPGGPSWTSVFSDEMVRIGHDHRDVVAITAAMLAPTGLDRFAEMFPDRTYDVGIAEQHAATSAAGLAYGGMHPVVALYATFLNRAFDQVLMDCALHRAGVTFVLDRAGITGDDGPSHNGMWDLSMLQVVPGLRIAAPRDEATLRQALRDAVEVKDAPTVVRFAKGALGPDLPALRSLPGVDVLVEDEQPEILLIGVGAMAGVTADVADGIRAQGFSSLVVNPTWVKPVPEALADLARGKHLVLVVEDGVRQGGVGSAVSQFLRDADIDVPVRNVGVPVAFLDQAKRADLLTSIGLTAQDISRQVVEMMASEVRDPAPSPTVSSD